MLSLLQFILFQPVADKICIEIRGDTIGKLAVLDISKNGWQIWERLFALLTEQ